MFSNVLKKFFTRLAGYENKVATRLMGRRTTMMQQIKSVVRSSGDTLLQDAVGGVALVIMLVLALHVPGFV
jgi:hypothetical protein